jgi:hypothetical protein
MNPKQINFKKRENNIQDLNSGNKKNLKWFVFIWFVGVFEEKMHLYPLPLYLLPLISYLSHLYYRPKLEFLEFGHSC